MSEDFIDYSALVDEAMHIIVKKSLDIVSKTSFVGDHHFFISFLTSYPGVEISNKLKKKYSDEMTIVLQYQYENLNVYENHFEVTLSFDGIKEKVKIPFKALTAFADPSVKFGLQFRHFDEEFFSEEQEDLLEEELEDNDIINANKSLGGNNVITLESFRNQK